MNDISFTAPLTYLNFITGTIVTNSPSFASNSSRVAPWHSTPDGIARQQNIIHFDSHSNVNPANQPSSG